MGKKKSGKKKKNKTKGIFKRDVLDSDKRPEEFEIVKDKIWWEGNPDKSKKYRRKKFEQKKFLTPREAEAFLEVTGNWLSDFILGKNNFPKLPYTINGKDRDSIRFSREDLEKYRKKNLIGKKFSTKTKPQQK